MNFKVDVKGEEFQVLVEGDFYRVCNTVVFKKITDDVIIAGHKPTKESLNIEEKQDDGTYIVVGSFNYNSKTGVTYQDYVLRTFKTMDDAKELKLREFSNCCNFAIQALKDLNGE